MSIYYKPRKKWFALRLSRGVIFAAAVLTLVVGAAVEALNQRSAVVDARVSATIPPIPDASFAGAFQAGMAARDAGDTLRAWLEFSRAIDMRFDTLDTPLIDDAYYLRGQMAEALNLFESARADYAAALTFNPRHAGATQDYSIITNHLSGLRMAAGDPMQIDDLDNRGRMHLQRKEFAEALAIYDTLIANEPDNSYYRNMRGYIYPFLPEQNFVASAADFERALRLNPADGYAYMGAAYAYGGMGDYERAWPLFARALDLEPDYLATHIAWGLTYQRMGDTRMAAAHYWAWMSRPEAQFVVPTFSGRSFDLAMYENRVYRLSLTGRAGERLNVVAGVDNPYTLDALLVLIDPNGQPIAGSDERIMDRDFNAQLVDVVLPKDGTYTLAVSHAGVGGNGTIRITYELGR